MLSIAIRHKKSKRLAGLPLKGECNEITENKSVNYTDNNNCVDAIVDRLGSGIGVRLTIY